MKDIPATVFVMIPQGMSEIIVICLQCVVRNVKGDHFFLENSAYVYIIYIALYSFTDKFTSSTYVFKTLI